jgi:hypothetical protein
VSRFKWLRLVGGEDTPSDEPEDKKKEKEEAPASAFDDLGEAMQSIRDSLKTMGGAFAAAAGVIVTGLGYARLHEAFPLPPYYRTPAVLALTVGALLALGGAAWFSGRFFAAQRRIPMYSRIPAQPREERTFLRRVGDFFSMRYAARKYGWRTELLEQSDEEKHVGLSKSEKVVRAEMFRDDARAEEASSLEALELRANRLERSARRQPEGPARKALETEVARINDAIRLTFRRTAAAILERRAQDAYYGWPTKAAVGAFIVGIGLLFATADWAKGERDLVALRAKCADAESKGASNACDPVRASHAAPTPTANDTTQRSGATQNELLAACVRRIFEVAKNAQAGTAVGNDKFRTLVLDKDVISAAIGHCPGAKPG